MCAKNHLLIFSSFLDIWENVEWPRFLDHPVYSSFFVVFSAVEIFKEQAAESGGATKAKVQFSLDDVSILCAFKRRCYFVLL